MTTSQHAKESSSLYWMVCGMAAALMVVTVALKEPRQH